MKQVLTAALVALWLSGCPMGVASDDAGAAGGGAVMGGGSSAGGSAVGGGSSGGVAGGAVAGGSAGGVAGGGDAGGSAGGSAGGDSGGTAGGSSGGAAGGTAGGESGGTAGGTAGGDAGGSAGGESGGTAGGASGGTAGGASAGTAGGASGGTAGGASGGTAGGSSGGTAGGSSGGTAGGTGGGAPPDPDRLAWAEFNFPAVGNCTRYELSVRAADGGPPTAPGAPWSVSVSLPSDAGVRFSTISNCANTISTVIVPSSTPAGVFLASTRIGPTTLTATHAQFGTVALPTDIRSNIPQSVTFTMPPVAQVGDCVPGTVAARDAYGNLLYRRGQTLTLSSTPSAELFASVDCSGPSVSNLNVPYPDSAVVPFSFRSMTGGNFSVVGLLTPSGVANSHALRLRVAPLRLTLTPLATQGFSDTCITGVNVNKVDALNAAEAFDGGETITLGGSPDVVYRAANCGGAPITQLTPAAGVSSVALGLRIAADAGAYLLTASEPSLGMTSSTVTVTGTRPTGLQLLNVPTTGVRGVCYPASVRFLDDAGAPTVTGVPTTMNFSGAQIWTDGGCGGPSNYSVPVAANASQTDFVFREDTSATVTVRADSTFSGLFAQQNVTMTNPTPAAIRFSGAYSGTTNLCYTGSVVLVSDAGVTAPAVMSTPVTVVGNAAGSVFVGNATANCAALSNSVNVTIPNGATSVNFLWRKGTAGTEGITAQSANYGDAGTTVTATNPCVGYMQGCNASTPCCSSTPTLTCGSGSVCRCVISGCIPRGGFNCGSSNNCCSGVISGSTCQ